MANQDTVQDNNQFPALIAHSGTAGTAETRKVVAENGAVWVKAFNALTPSNYDSITFGYPDGTTETFAYKLGTATTSTVTVTYTDSSKGSISTLTKT